MTDLLREAIADAKAVREVALANAKMALEEAFTPRIQSMLASKLSEEAEEEMEEGWNEGEEHEMEEGEETSHDMEEGEFLDDQAAGEISMEGYDEESIEEEEEEEVHVGEGEGEEEMPEPPAEEMDFEEEEEPMDEDLMEIIRQLEEELDSSEIGKGDNKQPSKTASDDHTEDKSEKLVQLVNEEEDETVEEGEESDDVDIQEIIRALREEEEEKEEVHEEEEKEEEKLQEAYAVIQFLREKLNEVNLLNSKLLFSNKLFRSYSLTESQKMTVIENFDRAGSLREVKLVYATLAESLRSQTSKIAKTSSKKSLKESFNRVASKPQASTRPSKKILSESNEVSDRFKKLAGLI
jgi:hypothetical protein